MAENIVEKTVNKLQEKDRIIMGGVVGSFNYGLGDGLSDNDLRFYVFPTMADLVRKRTTRRIFMLEDCDVQIHDVRRAGYFLNMGDANQLSVFFSKEQYINPKFEDFVQPIIEKREVLVKNTAPNIYAWGRSMFEKKMGQLEYYKLNETIYQQYGYNTKVAGQAIYHLKLIQRYFRNLEYGVDKPFEKALDCSEIRNLILNIRNGKYSLEEFREIADDALADYNGVTNIQNAGVNRPPAWFLNNLYNAVEKFAKNS